MIYDIWDEVLLFFCSIPKSNFWRAFDVFLDLVILHYIDATSRDFYVEKILIYINFV